MILDRKSMRADLEGAGPTPLEIQTCLIYIVKLPKISLGTPTWKQIYPFDPLPPPFLEKKVLVPRMKIQKTTNNCTIDCLNSILIP